MYYSPRLVGMSFAATNRSKNDFMSYALRVLQRFATIGLHNSMNVPDLVSMVGKIQYLSSL